MESIAVKKYTVNFHITHDCNMRCGYCYAGKKLKESMSDEIVEHSLDMIEREVKSKAINKLVVAFLGGEPLMEKELLYSIQDRLKERIGKETKIVYQLSTNGLLLTDKLMKELTERNTLISLSLDGTPETMLKQRPLINNADYSERMERAIKSVLKYNRFTNAFCVITPQSAANLYDNITWIYDQGLKFINTTLDYSAGWTTQDFELLGKEYKRLAKWYSSKADEVEHFYLSCFDERIQSRTKSPVACEMKCSLGKNQLSIAPDGSIFPCMQFVKPKHEADEEFVLGNVNRGIEGKKLKEIQAQAVFEKPECNGCELKSRCSVWCSCINYASTRTITKASPVACYHEKTLIPIVDEMANELWKQRNQLFLQKHYNPLYSFVAQAIS